MTATARSGVGDHTGRRYAVTGAGSGIGKALTELLRDRGATVVGIDLRDTDVLADLSTQTGRSELKARVEAGGDRLDGVAAVAGALGAGSLMVSVNYFGAVATLELLRPLLVASSAPRAAVVASMALIDRIDDELLGLLLDGDETGARDLATRIDDDPERSRGNVVYRTTKRAVALWMRANAITEEWAGAGIALNAIAPGITRTPMNAAQLDTAEGRAALGATAPIPLNGPAAPPSAPAGLLAWLTGPENTHVTGQIIYIDGGADAVRRPEVF